MQQLNTCDDPHVQDEPSDGVHHIRVPRPPQFSFNGNIHPLHQQSYAIGDKVYFEVSSSHVFTGNPSIIRNQRNEATVCYLLHEGE